MPSKPLPAKTSNGSMSRRSFFTAAGTAAATAALGPSIATAAVGETSFSDVAPRAFADNVRATGSTIERVLGATRCALAELTSHENDSYYLNTSFGNTGPDGAGGDISTWDSWHPNGNPKSNGLAYMNCVGFVVAVLEACGADCDIVGNYVGSSGYARGNKANLSRWVNYLKDHANMCTRYESKNEMLDGGNLRKGDLLIAEPRDWSAADADCHVLFFWGDTPSQDLAWHSSNHADGVIAGCCPGNMISSISTKAGNCYWLHVPLSNLVELSLTKRSADISVATGTEGAPYYSLENAQFSIYSSYDNGQLSGYVTSFSTDVAGHASVKLEPGANVWVQEDCAPVGFGAWKEPLHVSVPQNDASQNLDDVPMVVQIRIRKQDEETKDTAQGHATLAGAVYELQDCKGNSYLATTALDAESNAHIATFPQVARGAARLREVSAPVGYNANALPGAGEDGWLELSLAPDGDALCAVVDVVAPEKVMRGDIEGAKFYDPEGSEDESTKAPLAGAVFDIWLQDDTTLAEKGYSIQAIKDVDGNAVLNNAGETLFGWRAGSVTTHGDGRFTSHDLLNNWLPEEHAGLQAPDYALPYGKYCLIETFCPDSSLRLAEPICDIEVYGQGVVEFRIVSDRRIYSPVRVRKTDAETGGSVLAAGTQIELLRKDSTGAYKLIEFDAHSPADSKTSRFTVGETGVVQFPEKLPYGSYAIAEVSTVAPYLCREEPVYFEVSRNHDWGDTDLLTIDLPNKRAYGRIVGVKIDQESKAGVAGARFEARAVDDIVYPDGSIALKSGEYAGDATSDEQGNWVIEHLPLGCGVAAYAVREVVSPDGYVENSEAKHVVLSWQNDTTPAVEANLEVIEVPTSVRIVKVDAQTKQGIAGVEFLLELADEGIEGDATLPAESARTLDLGNNAENAGDGNGGSAGPDVDAENEKTTLVTINAEEGLQLETDENGETSVLRLARRHTYRLSETKPRLDLGYIPATWSETRYLAENGCWYESEPAWQEAAELGTRGEEFWRAEVENDFTKLSFYKVDAAKCKAAETAGGSAEDHATELAASQAYLQGGLFCLRNSTGKAVAPANEGLAAEGWAAQGSEPVLFTHLVAGETYTMEEQEAPTGYIRQTQRAEIAINDDGVMQTLVLSNSKVEAMPKTGDDCMKVGSLAGLVLAGGALASLAYTKRRMENEAA